MKCIAITLKQNRYSEFNSFSLLDFLYLIVNLPNDLAEILGIHFRKSEGSWNRKNGF